MVDKATKDKSLLVASGVVLARNTVFNLIGQGLPLLVAVLAIPMIIGGLGRDRFGVLSVAWVIIGYFSLFDLGLGRALTKLLADKLGTQEDEGFSKLVWTCLLLMLLLGAAWTLVMALFCPFLVHQIFRIPKALQIETLHVFYLLAFSIPVVIVTAGLRGVLAAKQRFDLINLVRVPLGTITYLGPLLVLPFSQSVFPVVAVLALSRLVVSLVYLWLCFHVMPVLRRHVVIGRSVIRPLLRLGGWITISNIVSPLMTHLDRFLIGALISMTAVTYYVTPYEVVTKLWLIPGAMVGVLFPAFATSFVTDPSRTFLFFSRGVKYVFLALFPIALVIITFAPEGLDLWLGRHFVQHSTRVLRVLTLGVFINSLAQMPFALIQAVGRPDLTAKLHMVELPSYLVILWWMIATHGIDGAAVAWLIRVMADTAILFVIVRRLLPNKATAFQGILFMLMGGSVSLTFAMVELGLSVKVFFLLSILTTFGFVVWFQVLTTEERTIVRHSLRSASIFRLIGSSR